MAAPLARLLVASASLLICSCEPRRDPAFPVSDSPAPGNCASLRPQTEPDLMAWDPGSRANLNRLRHEGVVAVQYKAVGCDVTLKLLSHCIGKKSKYAYTAYGETQTKTAHNANELYTELPLGAARLAGKLKGARALRTDYTLVGTLSLPPDETYERGDLRGKDCEEATHVVSAIYVGGFAMAAGESSKIEASANLFVASSGGALDTSLERLDSAGSVQACAHAMSDGKETVNCAIPLRIGLLPVGGGSSLAVAEARAAEAAVQAPAPSASAPEAGASPPSSVNPEVMKLMSRALEADSGGRLEECIEANRAALALEAQPRTMLHLASCERRSGKLIDALRNAQRSLELGIQKGDASLMRVARTRIKELLEVIPKVTFAARASVILDELSFDDRTVPLESMSKNFSVDPGRHTVKFRGKNERGPLAGTSSVDVAEGQKLTVTLPP